jgi:hypothetical protein
MKYIYAEVYSMNFTLENIDDVNTTFKGIDDEDFSSETFLSFFLVCVIFRLS